MSQKKPEKSQGKKGADPHAPLTHRGLKGLEEARAKLEEPAPTPAPAAGKGAPAKPAPKAPAAKPAPARRGDDVWRPDLDKELLQVALAGVKPLEKRSTGAASSAPRPAGPSTKARRVSAQGDEGLAVRWDPQGGCEGVRKGRAFALEALGRFVQPEEQLDLHGLEEAMALLRVQEFVRSRRERGLRVVALVHGKGLHAPDGHPLLRDAVVRALSSMPGCVEVDAFRGEPGGADVLVALRSRDAKKR